MFSALSEEDGVRLISWNVSWQSRATPRERIAFLAAHTPDVVALQEVRNLNPYVSELRSIRLPQPCGLRVESGLGLLVGARWKVEPLGSATFRIPDDECHLYRNPPAQGEV